MFGVAYINAENCKTEEQQELTQKTVMSFVDHASKMEAALFKIVTNFARITDGDLRKLLIALLNEKIELGYLSFCCGNNCRTLEKLVEVEFGPSNVEEHLKNVRPKSSSQVFELREVVQIVKKEEDCVKLFCENEPVQVYQTLKEKYPSVLKALNRYLLKYFGMCENDEDILEERFIDNPSPLIQMIKLQIGTQSLY